MTTPDLAPYAKTLRRHDPDRFFTALFAPPARRDALYLLYAFNHELARAREVASEPVLALIRLQWWREVVEGADRRHELATPLGRALADGILARDDLLEMIEGREAEAEPSIATDAQWRAYIDHAAGAVAGAAGRALGADAPTLLRLRALGAAYGMAGVLRGLGTRAREGRCLLPEDRLGGLGLTIHQVMATPDDHPRMIADFAAEGRGWLAQGRGRYPREVRAAALVGVYARRDLARIGRLQETRRTLCDRLAVTWAAATGIVG